MKEVDLSMLQVGQETVCEYFSREGDLLISRGVALTPKHIEALKRRNFTTVFMREDAEDDELHKILLAEFKVLDELSLVNSEKKQYESPVNLAKALKRPEFANIKPGKDGLMQLINSRKGAELDAHFKEGYTLDRPVGPALKEGTKQMKKSERTDQYKSMVTSSYTDALGQTKMVLNSLSNGENVDGNSVRYIVDNFIKTFINDRNILLNISGIKPNNEDYIYHHSLNVCLLSINIAASFGYNEQQVQEIGMGALLHDVGMLLIAPDIRMKENRLNEDEWFEIQKHPILGLHLLEKLARMPESVPFVAYQSHERENGKGYPKQRSSRLIHCYAKIVQIADIYEALSSPRTYREPHMPYKAMEMVIKMTRQGLISGEFVKAFLEYTSLFPVGSMVELSNNCCGKVIRSSGSSFAKPVVSILFDPDGKPVPQDKTYEEDLSVNTTIQIVKALAMDYDPPKLMQGF